MPGNGFNLRCAERWRDLSFATHGYIPGRFVLTEMVEKSVTLGWITCGMAIMMGLTSAVLGSNHPRRQSAADPAL